MFTGIHNKQCDDVQLERYFTTTAAQASLSADIDKMFSVHTYRQLVLKYGNQLDYILPLRSKVHNVQCTPELQVRVPGQGQAGQGGKERTQGEGESSNPSSSSGQEISLSLQPPEANKVLSIFEQRCIAPCDLKSL